MQTRFNNKHYHLFNIYYGPSALWALLIIFIKKHCKGGIFIFLKGVETEIWLTKVMQLLPSKTQTKTQVLTLKPCFVLFLP